MPNFIEVNQYVDTSKNILDEMGATPPAPAREAAFRKGGFRAQDPARGP